MTTLTIPITRFAEEIREDARRRLAAVPAPSHNGNATEQGGDSVDTRPAFPVLSDTALYGLAGEIVRLVEPHTEADNAALLVQLLSAFGCAIGRTAHFKIGADYHYLKLNFAIVGATSQGRKGTSWGVIESLMVRVDETFCDVVQNGMSSGEGLIYHVRDEQTKKTPIREKGRIVDYQDEIIDAGATEKRAFILEPELARVLKVIARDVNTLSPVIRQAWDTDRLRIMTKNPVKATGAHISIIGHITRPELIRNLDETEKSNGFANRFCWVCVRRSKYLPDGGFLAEYELNGVVNRLRRALEFAQATGAMVRDGEASELWRTNYKRLSDGYGGLLGSVTSRATAQVMRLACVYALLDESETIRAAHLRAAFALWQYCEDSAKYIFGMSTGDKTAEEILSHLSTAPEGLSKTDISNRLNRNRTSSEIQAALQTLQEYGKIERLIEPTAGRPKEIFRALMSNELDEFNELTAVG